MPEEIFTEDVLKSISSKTIEGMNANQKSIVERAQAMEDAQGYIELTDFCYEQMMMFIDNPNELKKILTDPQNTGAIFNSIADQEEFKELESEEKRNFPRVVLMSVVAGSEMLAAHNAYELLKDTEEASRLDSLANVYNGYLKDAFDYGHGNNKSVTFAGEKQ